jgi:trimeric autotransporter adhesin
MQPTVERPAVVAMSSKPAETANGAESAPGAAAPAGPAAADEAPTVAAKAAATTATRAPENVDALGKQRAAPGAEAHVTKNAAMRRNEVVASVEQRRAAESTSRDVAPRQDTAAPQPAAPPAAAAAPGTDQPSDRLTSASGRAAAPATAQPPAAPAARPAMEPPTSARSAAGLRAALPDARKAELGEAVTVASPALALLRRTQAELAAGSAVWTWGPPGSGAMVPYDAAARAWLSRVVQAARGRWVDVGERGESLDALEARWWRDGWPHATLRIEAEGLRWIEPGGRIRYAPLDATTLRQLRSF